MSTKYHERHPTVSYRCRSVEEHIKIKEAIKNSGKSESDFIREIVLGAVEKESKSYLNGLNQLAWTCPVCKKLYWCQITKIFEKQSLVKFLQNHLEKDLCHPESLIELYQRE